MKIVRTVLHHVDNSKEYIKTKLPQTAHKDRNPYQPEGQVCHQCPIIMYQVDYDLLINN